MAVTAVSQQGTKPTAAWGAVLSMALCVAMLIASEFMPASLLTPMADGLTRGARFMPPIDRCNRIAPLIRPILSC